MKIKKHSLKKSCLIFFIIITNCALSQQTGCKVMMSSISGKYSGACKNGLASGIGIAQGINFIPLSQTLFLNLSSLNLVNGN